MPDFAKPKSSYRKLYVFQKAEAIYDLTYFFLQPRIPKSDRTYDQMLQAARSGKQNIVEGRSDAAEDYMRTRRIGFWGNDNPRYVKLSIM